jgi:uncharacterized membrane protein YphA (DoxX/SURF4 family)
MATWGLSRRILFRFACSYFVLYCMPGEGRVNILSSVPGSEWLFQPWTWLLHAVCPWVAIHVFGLSGQRTTYFVTGSGDTTLAWIENLLFVVIALLATIIWSLTDRRRPDYRTAHAWLRVLVRYTLAFTLFAYGFAKVAPLQFQPPRLPKLVQPYGESSPMGVLWNFMGSSLPYTMLAGAAEMLGGLLLLFRRTTTLGALVSFCALANVVALNFCYDVPVKLYSTNLLLMCVFLLAPDLRRLIDVLVLNRASEPAAPMAVTFKRRQLRIAALSGWVLLAGWTLFAEVRGSLAGYRQTYLQAKHPAAYGLYAVDTFRLDGRELAADPERWTKAWFIDQGFGARTMDDKATGYPGKFDDAGHTLTMSGGRGSLTWTPAGAGGLTVEGDFGGRRISAQLRKIDTAQMLLNSRGFHWISEFPFNR